MMKVSIICIGDEILMGDIIDTNSNYISKVLYREGFDIVKICSVPDKKDSIKNEIENSFKISDIIISTGGLGPTDDDITKNALCEYFSSNLVIHQQTLSRIEGMLKKRNRKVNKNNYNQALIPHNAKVFENIMGTAPGLILEKNNKTLISLPGVPFELKNLISTKVLDYLKTKVNFKSKASRYMLISGIPEAELAQKTEKWNSELTNYARLAFLPKTGYIHIRIDEYNVTPNSKAVINDKIKDLYKIIPDNIISETSVSLNEYVSELLKKNKLNIATAESCTGGKIAAKITSIPGCSEYFKGSVVAYSNKIKANILGVDKKLIDMHGAVSSEVVEAMAINILKLFDADISVASSGIAGPGGGTEQKPVGTVWIAVAGKHKTVSRKFYFPANRTANIEFFTNMAFYMIYDFIKSEQIRINKV